MIKHKTKLVCLLHMNFEEEHFHHFKTLNEMVMKETRFVCAYGH